MVLPEPDSPTKATVFFAGIVRLTSSIVLEFSIYEKETFLNLIDSLKSDIFLLPEISWFCVKTLIY